MTATAASCLGFSFLLLRVHKHNCNSHVQTRNSAGASYHRIKLSAPPLSSKQQKGKRNSPKIWCEISRLCSHGVKSNVSELCTDKFYPGLSVVHMCSAEWDVICLLFWRNFSHKTAYLVQMYWCPDFSVPQPFLISETVTGSCYIMSGQTATFHSTPSFLPSSRMMIKTMEEVFGERRNLAITHCFGVFMRARAVTLKMCNWIRGGGRVLDYLSFPRR